MKSVFGYIYIVVLALLPIHVYAAYMYWDADFDAISLTAISNQGQISEDSSTVTLFMDGDAEITADNSAASQLSCATDELVTEYKLVFDGDGSSATGGSSTSYEAYNSFLSTASAVTYVAVDDNVEVTLFVRVRNNADEVADAGAYSATQTLTVTWVGP